MKKSIKEIYKVLKTFIREGIVRTSLDDYAIIVFPREMMSPLTPQIRRKVDRKIDEILLDNKIRRFFYIHFGLCSRKCSGCHYGIRTSANKDNMVKAILDHIGLFPSLKYSINKSYLHFGGGTPSLMSIEEIKSIYNKIINKFNIQFAGATLEIHPEIIRLHNNPEKYIKLLKDIGIDRVSLGMQECNNKVLKRWGRGHTINDTLKVYSLLKKYKFKINLDLIWNLPNQTFKSLEKSLRTAFKLSPESVCTYFFWLRPGTKDYELYKKGRLKLLDKPIEMKYIIKLIASEYGYRQRTVEWFFKERDLTKSFNIIQYFKFIRLSKREGPIINDMDFALIGFGPSSYHYLFSGFEENYMLWSPINNSYRKMIDSNIIPYDRILIFEREETIRLHLMFSLRAKMLSKEKLDYFIKGSINGEEIELLVNNFIKYRLLTWDDNDYLTFTDAGDIIPNQIIATFVTDEWLKKMIKIMDKNKIDRYFWFPNPEMVFRLKNMIKKSI